MFFLITLLHKSSFGCFQASFFLLREEESKYASSEALKEQNFALKYKKGRKGTRAFYIILYVYSTLGLHL
jgi:hypothetical protein